MSGLRVDLGGVEFNSGNPDADGNVWWMTEFDGWDSPDLRQVLVEPTGQHGSHIASATFAARAIVIGGVVKSPTQEAFWQAYSKVSAITNHLHSTIDMTVQEIPYTKRLAVARGGRPRKQIRVAHIEFELPLLAPDPLKYNNDESSDVLPGTIANAGDFETYPLLTLTAGGDYTIINTTQGAGASLVIEGAPAGAVVDMRKRTVELGGVDYYNTVQPQSVWWALLPGDNIITVTGGAADIAWRDAWL